MHVTRKDTSYTLMRAADESPRLMLRYAKLMRWTTFAALTLALCTALTAFALLSTRTHLLASAPAPVTLETQANATRAAIPVTIDGHAASCILDTGTSTILVSPSVAHAARLISTAGTFELAPDGHTSVDRQTSIARFGVAGYVIRGVPALISANLSGNSALCGYDFFAHFPALIDRDRQRVTLFPHAASLDRLRCLVIDVSPHVPLASIEINGTWVRNIVLDSGMAGGGALWDGVRSQLRQPLVTDAAYQTEPSAARAGLACGSSASVRFTSGTPVNAMPICTESQRPDGYNGIIETNLPSIHAMAVDYPHHRICFDIRGSSELTSSPASADIRENAWSRFNYLRPPHP